MRITASVAALVLRLSVICLSGCSETPPVTIKETTVTLSVDMPRVQTLQFLKQSASTLKLGTVQNDSEDTIIAGGSKAVVSGPAAGPVTVVLHGAETSVSKWSTMLTDKLPSKKR
jgi:hypothetical protein